ncbi:MAG TPA: hypothetical protein VND87_05060 [Stellaceae bacterium]|nr:hypothetical protein [Stellaceae bacterium]
MPPTIAFNDAIAEAADFLADEAARAGGQTGEFFWIFPPPRPAARPA